MTDIPPIASETGRLAILDSYRIVDSAPEQGFDDVVLLARQICVAPVALVSFVQAKRQWFKAATGVPFCETPIEQSVCAHALMQSETFVIPDLSKDERTRHNPLVAGEPGIRFYAGALLKTPAGVPLGTVCVVDMEPRPAGLTPDQREGLEALARQVMLLLELRRAVDVGESVINRQREDAEASDQRSLNSDRFIALLQANETRLRLAQEAGKIGTFEIDVATGRMTVSEQFCRIYGLPETASLLTSDIEKLIIPGDEKLASTAVQRESGDAPLIAEYRIKRPDTGEVVWVSRRGEFVYGPSGRPQRMIGTVHDVTERKRNEQTQETLKDELGHRLKNTLALVQAIATQTLRSVADRNAVRAFEQRVSALSRAHEVLIQKNWVAADMRTVIENVLDLQGETARFKLSGPTVSLDDKAALSLSLLIHELATNALKYGSLSVPKGIVEVSWLREQTDLVLRWKELDGPSVQEPKHAGLGTRLIKMGFAGTGVVSRRYDPLGLSIEFRAPLALVEKS